MTTTFNRSLLAHVAIGAAAFLGTAVSFTATATPAYAASPGYYQAQLVTPADSARTEVQNGVAWKCAGGECRGTEGTSRPEVVCARLARKVGPLTGFAVKGEALDADALAKCNGEKPAPLARR
ncbi:MAG TPA: hypothetical protein VM055_07655 [Novosphingobium sp.]|nr:hypothetical protein [Novosphingobium sp.]